MANNTDIMAWMGKAYIKAQPVPWYRKISLYFKLFIERRFKRVKGTPGARVIDETLKAGQTLRQTIQEVAKPTEMTREQRARMWDSL